MDTTRPETHQWLKELPSRALPTAMLLAASALRDQVPLYRIAEPLKGTLYYGREREKRDLKNATTVLLATLLAAVIAYWVQTDGAKVGR